MIIYRRSYWYSDYLNSPPPVGGGVPNGRGGRWERNSFILLLIGILLFYLPPPPTGTPPPPTPPLSGESNSQEEENLRYFRVTILAAKLSFTSKRLQRSDKFFAGEKSQIGQNWFNLEISKVYIIFVQHKITPNGLFHTHQKHQWTPHH